MEIMEEDHGKCHSCNAPAEGQCERCYQGVCTDCIVPFTYMNQIDYTVCNDCNDDYEYMRGELLEKEQAENAKINRFIEKYGDIEKGMARYYKQKKIINSLSKYVDNDIKP